MAKRPRDVQEALERLAETRNRVLQLGIPEGARAEGFEFTDAQAAALIDAHNIGQCMEELLLQITHFLPEGEQLRAILNLQILTLTMEKLFRVDLAGNEIENDVRAHLNARLERARAAINRKPASFYDAVVEHVFKEHVEAHGPWADRESKLARKLKPEIDRRAVADGGKPLEVDTITRRLKDLIASTRH